MEVLIAFISGFAFAIFLAYHLGRSPDEEYVENESTSDESIPRVHVEQVESQFLAFDRVTSQFLAQHKNLNDLIDHLASDGDIIVTFETKELEDHFTSNCVTKL
jgi:hypothetical protein